MTKVLSLTGTEKGNVKLPQQFSEEFRPDVIRRAVLALRTHRMQPHGTKIGAGNIHSAILSKRRRAFRTTYGKGQSRTPRKTVVRMGTRLTQIGAKVPQARGGRQAHPPRVEKILWEKINAKERKKAIRSAISASTIKEVVGARGHFVENLKELPIILEDSFEQIKKAKEVENLIKTLGLTKEVERTKKKKVRAGRGKTRGRKYKRKVGALFVVSKKCGLLDSAKNIAGIDVCMAKNLNAELLAPGGQAGRLVLWSESALKQLGEKKLFM